jgi:hypothetical protein
MAVLWVEEYSDHISQMRLRTVSDPLQLADHERGHLQQCTDCQSLLNVADGSLEKSDDVDTGNAASAA